MSDASPAARVPAGEFRRLMSRWATGVSVVTASHDGADAGLTVNALLSVSLDPPYLLVSLTQDADTTPVIRASGRFSVSFLAADQRALSERFAQAVPPEEKFRGLAAHRSPGGVPLLDGALGYLECRVVREIPLADHLLFVGEVTHARPGREGRPLVYYRGRYAEPLGEAAVAFPSPRE